MKREGKSKSNANNGKQLSAKRSKNAEDSKMRLNKFISNTGICSRREADKFIEAGVVSVNGRGITAMGYKINPNDIIKFNGQRLKSEILQYVLLNKPKNYSSRITTRSKTPSVINLIATACTEKIFPIDRLGNSDTGLLILTNDNDLAKKIGSKKSVIKSIYQITLDKYLSQLDLENIRSGIFINGKKNSFDSISYIQNKEKNQIGIEHHKGGIKYVKDIFEKLNYRVAKIDRVFFGGLTKKNLPRRHYRHLSKKEINILKRL